MPDHSSRPTIDIGEILASLYQHEISYSIAAEWDVGFYAHVGREDSVGGIIVNPATAPLPTLEDAVMWLVREAVHRHPGSSFAAEWRGRP